ncbi:hypothetical protein [Streptomyces sp. NRRL F-2580]|uniref:hypothetical protein n=1 Tax=Streptomyces sp. NRRL F-2580 TaxID=1463841 RepID=UPI0004C982AB|nr:hypothetical protein [Streptomyces sp. NRRL F-2580]
MHKDEAAAGLAELEGYLMSRAARHCAAREADAFADELPWLGHAEREEVVRLYTARHLARTRQVLHQITKRSHELKEEYSRRYETLRCRLLAVTFLSTVTTVGLLAMDLCRPR